MKKQDKVVWHEPATYLPNPHMPRKACIPDCRGCNKMYSDLPDGERGLEDFVCISYMDPNILHRLGECALKSNKVHTKDTGKKVNPLKASKRLIRKGI